MVGPLAAQHALPGQHVVEALLAEGRSARVYRVRAKDGSLRAARVARHDLDEVARAWFEADARLRKALDHPGLPRTYLVARLPSGEPMEVVELLPGPSLAARLDAAPRGLPLPEAARLLEQLASALDYLHAQARPLAHGGLSPARVSFRPRDGAAKLLGVQGPDRPTATPEAYRAPETRDGTPAAPAADVFGLATLSFEVLTGRAAFPEGPPRQPPEAWPSAHTIRAEVPEGVDAVLAQAWALDPSARPARASDLAARLLAALGLATPPASPEELTTREVAVPVRAPSRRAPPPGTRPSVPPPPEPAPASDPPPPDDTFDPTPLEIVAPPRQGPVSAPQRPPEPEVAAPSPPPQTAPPQADNPPVAEVPAPKAAPAPTPHPIEAAAPAVLRNPPPSPGVSAAQRAWLRQPTLVLPPQSSPRAWHKTPGVLAALLVSAAIVVAGLGHAIALALRPAAPATVTIAPQAVACPPCPVCAPTPASAAPAEPPTDLPTRAAPSAPAAPASPLPGTRTEARRSTPMPPPPAPRRAPTTASLARPIAPRPAAAPRPSRTPRTRLIQQTPF